MLLPGQGVTDYNPGQSWEGSKPPIQIGTILPKSGSTSHILINIPDRFCQYYLTHFRVFCFIFLNTKFADGLALMIFIRLRLLAFQADF